LQIDVMRPSALGAPDLERWSALQAADPALDSPFLSPGWALAVERAQVGLRGDVKVAVVRDGGQAKAFFATRVVGGMAMPAGSPMSDYQAIVAEPGFELDAPCLLRALGVHRLDFFQMLEGQPTFAPYRRGEAASWVVEAANGYEVYQAQRREAGSGLLKDIEKRRRKIERDLGEVTFTAQSTDRADFDQLIAWKRGQYRQTNQTDIFSAGWPLHLIEGLLEAGEADPGFGGALFTLHIGAQLAAAQFNLRGRHTLHAWIIAHGSGFEKVSPGLVLFGEILRWMDATPLNTLDLGPGDYRFKQQLATCQRRVAHGFVGRPSAQSLVRSAEYGVRAAAETLPLGALSHLPGKAMRRMDLWRGLH
jgi:CelD/BcsL family acetyltransferase involved in cellulose biosynthesis